VVRPFVSEYLAGRTPIPCTLCNNFIKFDQFLEMADSVGAHHIATGHYARIAFNSENGRYELRKGVDQSKDQTYFLFGLTQAQLARTMFPIGHLTKPEVRAIAEQLDVPVAAKNDSQEICFVPNGDYAAFLDAYLKEQGVEREATEGEFVTTGGRVLGRHDGVHHFTVGQRRGLRLATGEPLYVISTEPAARRVIVGRGEELSRAGLTASHVNWVSWAPITRPSRAQVKIRNKHDAAWAILTPTGDPSRVGVRFDLPQRAVTPGQAAVFYLDDLVLGGGWID
jgi:tRNA-specific 2-thiouridylase